MSRLAENSYGKSDVRLTKVVRNGERHDLHELTVRIMLGGAFERVYTDGDNSMCIPTDTMKNSVYALARTNTFDSPEAFAALLGAHFLEFDQVAWAEVDVLQERWSRITVKGSPHPHAFTREASGARTARVRADRGAAQKTWGGVRGLEVIKTTRSGFAGFYKDPLTTLPEVGDRIFATSVDAEWEHETTGPSSLLRRTRKCPRRRCGRCWRRLPHTTARACSTPSTPWARPCWPAVRRYHPFP